MPVAGVARTVMSNEYTEHPVFRDDDASSDRLVYGFDCQSSDLAMEISAPLTATHKWLQEHAVSNDASLLKQPRSSSRFRRNRPQPDTQPTLQRPCRSQYDHAALVHMTPRQAASCAVQYRVMDPPAVSISLHTSSDLEVYIHHVPESEYYTYATSTYPRAYRADRYVDRSPYHVDPTAEYNKSPYRGRGSGQLHHYDPCRCCDQYGHYFDAMDYANATRPSMPALPSFSTWAEQESLNRQRREPTFAGAGPKTRRSAALLGSRPQVSQVVERSKKNSMEISVIGKSRQKKVEADAKMPVKKPKKKKRETCAVNADGVRGSEALEQQEESAHYCTGMKVEETQSNSGRQQNSDDHGARMDQSNHEVNEDPTDVPMHQDPLSAAYLPCLEPSIWQWNCSVVVMACLTGVILVH